MRNEISLLSESQIRSIKDIDEETFEEMLMEINLKKPMNAYNIYIKELKEKSNSSLNVSHLSHDNTSNWTTLSESEKNRYREMSEEDTKRYKYHLALVKKYILEKPLKEFATSYMIFKDEYIKEAIENEKDPKEARKEAQEKWKTLSTEEKKIYEGKKEKHRELYEALRRMKGPINGYSLFVKDQLMQAKEKGENITLGEVSVIWKKLKPSIREKYYLYADELREEKERMRDLYEITFGITPRRPIGPYNFFVMEQAKEGKLEGKNPFKEAGRLWKLLTYEQKERYRMITKKSQLVYIVKKQELNNRSRRGTVYPINIFVQHLFKKGNIKGDIPSKNYFQVVNEKWNQLNEEEKQKYFALAKEKNEATKIEKNKLKMKNKPRRPDNPYERYISDNFEKVKKSNPNLTKKSHVIGEITRMWKELAEDDKKKYDEAYQKDLKEYKKKLIELQSDLDSTLKDESKSASNKKNARKSRAKSTSKDQEADKENDISRSIKGKLSAKK